MNRLREVFTLCACFLAIVRLPTTLSAPNPIDLNKPPIWNSPCNSGQDVGDGNIEHPDEKGPTNKELFEKVIILAQMGLDELTWKNSWVQENFGKDFETQFKDMKSSMNPPPYLPSFSEVGKSYGEPIPDDALQKLTAADTLSKTFEWLQRVAVGMERLTYDQYNDGESHAEDFKKAYFALRSVLCEIQDAMAIMKVPKSKDVDRTDMPASEQEPGDGTSRKIRDWTIFVIYINLLDYTKQAYERLALQER